jgi:hypothetical protein
MTLELFALCDRAIEENTFLHITAITDRAYASKVPLLVKKMCIVWRMRFSTAECGEHRAIISVIDADGKPVGGFEEIKQDLIIRNEAVFRAWNGILNATDVSFPKFGEYSFQLLLDGEEKASIPLFVLAEE